jgi:glycosyltransferase involved in cell wall biosynthesis
MNVATPKVNILLSTYNGERFIREQLDSLQSQDYPNISMYVRDDGSTDSTIDLLQEHQAKYPKIKLVIGENVGYIKSFYELVRICGGNDDELYAFCDQDDVWEPQKISRSVTMILGSLNPSETVYFSRMKLVDENLKQFGLSSNPLFVDFGSTLMGISYGCTVVFSQGIRQLFLKANPNNMLAHDWWICLIAASFGYLVYDPQPQVQYRHHGSNTTAGYRANFLQRLKFRMKEIIERFFNKKPTVDFLWQAEQFISTYNNIPLENKVAVEELIKLKDKSLFPRFLYICAPKVYANNSLDNITLKLMIILGCQ